MTQRKTVIEITDLWPTLVVVGEAAGVPAGIVKMWRIRNSIPAKYWQRLVADAQRRNLDVTYEMLAESHAA